MPSIQHLIDRAGRRIVLSRSMSRFSKCMQREIPKQLIEQLIYGWGNSWSAKWEYTTEIIKRAFECDGTVLECGSGLSTLLLGKIADRTGKRVVTLEHDEFWAGKILDALKRYRISNVDLHIAPLIDYGEFSWYQLNPKVEQGQYALVICDGPPQNTPGGRYGLLPVMRSRLTDDCVILLDDANREKEQKIIRLWGEEKNTRAEISGDEDPFAVITFNN